MANFNDFLKNLNADSIRQIQSFVQSDKGKELVDQLKSSDKNTLMQKLGSISDEEKQNMLSQISNNPELMKKIKDILN